MSPLLDSNLISTKKASELSGYNADYIGRLCRSGKINGERIGRAWVIDEASLRAFIAAQHEHNENRARELSESRAREYHAAQKNSISGASVLAISDTVQSEEETPAPVTSQVDTRKPVPSPFHKSFVLGDRAAALLLTLAILNGSIALAHTDAIGDTIALASTDASAALDGTATFARMVVADIPSYEEVGISIVRGIENNLSLYGRALTVSGDVVYEVATNIPTEFSDVGVALTRVYESGLADYIVGIENVSEVALDTSAQVRDTVAQTPLSNPAATIAIAFGETLISVSENILRAHATALASFIDISDAAPRAIVATVLGTGEVLGAVAANIPQGIAQTYQHDVYAIAEPIADAGLIAAKTSSAIAQSLSGSRATLASVANFRLTSNGSTETWRSEARLAAVAEGTESTNIGRSAALYTYITIRNLFADTENAFVSLFAPKVAVVPTVVPAVKEVPVRTPIYVPTTTAPRAPVTPVPSYSMASGTTVQNITNQFVTTGVSYEYLEQRLRRLSIAILDRPSLTRNSSGSSSSGGGSGSVTSVDVSGGATGFSFAGGPITSSGTFTLSGVLDIDNGGTGIATAPSYGELLMGDGLGGYSLVATSSLGITGGSGSPGGANTQVQFNNAGTFAGDAGFVYDSTADRLTVTNASTTNISSSYASSTAGFFGALSIGNLSGLLKSTAGVVSVATGGTDYENPLTFAYPLQRSVNAISLAFGTTTANTWGAQNIFTGLFATNASSTNATTTAFGINSETFTDLTGTGLQNVGGALTLNATGDWTGTFDGQQGTFYLDRANHTGTQLSSTISDFSAAVASYINGSSTIPHIGGSAYGDILSWTGSAWERRATSTLGIALTDTTGTLGQAQGGTGITSYTAGDLLYANGGGTLTPLGIGSAGQVLKVTGGLPQWGADLTTGGGGGAGAWATTSDSLAIYPTDTSDVVIVGNSATTTANSILEVFGRSYFSNFLGIGTTSPGAMLSVAGNALINGTVTALGNITGPRFVATSSVASVLPYASTTGISASYASSTNLFAGSLTLGSLTGVLKATAGAVSTGLVNLATEVTGTLGISNGGTGTSTPGALGDVLSWNGTNWQGVATSTLGFLTNAVTAIGPAGQTADGPTVTFATSTTGTDFTITGSGDAITFNIPSASSANRGLLLAADWTGFNNKVSTTSIDTVGELETLTGVNLIVSTEIDTIGEIETLAGAVNIILATEIDSLAEIETLAGVANILIENDIDASTELAALVDDETGSGALVFGTSPTFSGIAVFASLSATNATTTSLGINSETFTDLTGTGLQNVGGALTLNATGDWTGTFDGQEGSYYLANSFSTTSANFWETQQTARTADDLTNNSIEDLSDVAAMSEALGDLLSWNGSAWTNVATSTLGFITNAVTAIGPAGQTADGPTVTFATSTGTFNGLTTAITVTGSGDTLTFAPSITGTLNNAGLTNSTVSYGGVSLALGGTDATPAFNLVDATGLPISTGVAGLGTGAATALGVNIGTAGSFVVNGGALGTPSSGTLTNATGLPIVGGTTGTLSVARGGTGTTTAPAGQVLYGGGAGVYESVATTSVTIGSGLSYSGTFGSVLGGAAGSLTLNATGDWTGTLDGQEGSYYLSRANHTGTQLASTISDFDSAVASYINASTTLWQDTTEASLEAFLTDVTNVFTNNDGALADDDLTNNSIEDLSDVAAMTENFGDLLYWNGSAWADIATSSLGITGTAAGSDTQVQFNNNGSFAGDSGFTYSSSTDRITVTYASTTGITSSYASSTAGFFGSLTLGSLTGVLKATAGAISTGLVNLATEVTGTLPVGNGGTGAATFTNNRLITGNGTDPLVDESNLTFDGSLLTVTGNASTTQISASGRMYIADGSEAAPAFTFSNDTDTGFHRTGANVLAVIAGGTTNFQVNNSATFFTKAAEFDLLATFYAGATVDAGVLTVPLGDATAPSITFPSDTNTGIFGATDIIGFTTAGTERMRINASGNVGIGTTTPAVRLGIFGAGGTGGLSVAGSVSGLTTANAVYIDDNGGEARLISVGADTATKGSFSFVNSGLSATGFTTAMTITSAGNVGIGTTSPWRTFSVSGNSDLGINALAGSFTATTTATSTFPTLSLTGRLYDSLGTAGTNGYVLQSTGSASQWVSTSSLNIAAAAGGSNTQVQYNSGGALAGSSNFVFDGTNVGIGAAPTRPLHVTGTANDTTNGSVAVVFGTLNSTTNSQYGLFVNPTVTLASAATVTKVGFGFQPYTTSTQLVNATLVGGQGGVYLDAASGSTSALIGLQSINTIAQAGGMATTSYSVVAGVTNAGKLDNTYGFYAGDLTSGTQTNTPYSFYASDSGTYNYFAGSVGIGSTTPILPLSINGNGSYGGHQYSLALSSVVTAGPGILFTGNTAYDGNNWQLAALGSGNSAAGATGGFAIIDRTNNVSRLVLDSAGDAGIGTTTPYAKLSITNTGSGPSFLVEDATSADTTPFVIDAAGLVGIGTTTPYAKLSVVGSAVIGGSAGSSLSINNGAATDAYVYFDSALHFAKNGTGNRISILDGGNVGIGDSTPDYKFEVEDSSSANFAVLTIANSAAALSTSTLAFAPGNSDPFSRGALINAFNNGSNAISLGFSVSNGAAPAEALRISPTGTVGIGTTSPYGLLSVTNTGSGPSFLVEDATSVDSTPFVVTAAGDVGIGSLAPSSRLDILASASNLNAFQIFASDAGSLASIFADGSNNAWLRLYDTSGNEDIRLNTAGDSYFNGGSVGIATSTPLGVLSVEQATENYSFLVGNTGSTTPSLVVRGVNANGHVGVNTYTPGGLFTVAGEGSSDSSNYGAVQILRGASGHLGSHIAFVRAGTSVIGMGYAQTSNTFGLGIGTTGAFSPSYLSINPANSYVGISTTTPTGLLSIEQGTESYSFWVGNTGSTTPSLMVNGVNGDGRVGVGVNSPNAKLDILAGSATALSGTAFSTLLRTNAGALGTTATNEVALASIGYTTGNSAALGVRAYRTSAGSDWTTQAIGLSMDVDSTVRAGAQLWLHANGRIGIATSSPGGVFSVEQGLETYSLYVANTGSTSPSLVVNGVNGNGRVGIGVAAPTAALHVSGGGVAGDEIVRLSGYGPDAANYMMSISSVVGSGTVDYRFRTIDLTGGTRDVLYFDSSSGFVGTGTTTPWRKFSVTDAVSTAQFAISYDTTRYAQFLVDSAGNLTIDAQNGGIFMLDENLWLCTGGSCPSGSPVGNGNLIVETSLGVGSSTPHAGLSIVAGKAIAVGENTLATSTSMTIDWRNGNQQLVRTGTAATSIAFSGYIEGQKLVLTVCNPNATAGAITFTTQVLWAGGTAPTQTTTANKCDVWSFLATAATSTMKIFGTQSANF